MSTDIDTDDLALAAARAFLGANLGGAPRIEPLGRGLINRTYRVDAGTQSFVLQRINGAVFPSPEQIMENLARLQREAAARPALGVRLPRLITAGDGKPYVRDADGGVWRLMEHVAASRTLHALQSPAQAREVGRTLGRFHCLGAGLPLDALTITLPGFHDTPRYLAALRQAAAHGVADDAAAVLAAIEQRAALADTLTAALQRGLTRARVIHGDPKLDNLLFDAAGEHAVCLIDLDTVQPGLVHHDIGDCLRSCCNRRGESAAGEESVSFDLELCAAILDAYAAEAAALLGHAETALIYPAIRLIPFELGIRFLTDHLQGDRYFRVGAHGENLLKARVQLALVEDIERKEDAIWRIVARSFAGARAL